MADDAERDAGAQRPERDEDAVAVEKLKADLRSLRNDLEAAARTVNQLGSTAAQEAMSQAQVQMEELRVRLDEFLNEARDYGDRSVEALRDQVQERPFASLLIAMATGFVLAHLMRR